MASALNIALSGLSDATQRVANAVSNIVNASSISALPKNPGDSYAGFLPQDIVSLSDSIGGVTTTSVPRNPAYVTAYDPNAPQANAQGLVATPNVDIASELVSAKVSQVNYSADAAVIKIAQKNEKALLNIIS